jgi:hypothetical protein
LFLVRQVRRWDEARSITFRKHIRERDDRHQASGRSSRCLPRTVNTSASTR